MDAGAAAAVNAQEADVVLGQMAERWAWEPTDADRRSWRAVLSPVAYEVAEKALKLLAADPRLPTKQQFVAAAGAVSRRREPGTGRCADCGGTGWVDAPVLGGALAVRRCSCSPAWAGEHPSGCSCSSCTYGRPESPDPSDPLFAVGTQPDGLF